MKVFVVSNTQYNITACRLYIHSSFWFSLVERKLFFYLSSLAENIGDYL